MLKNFKPFLEFSAPDFIVFSVLYDQNPRSYLHLFKRFEPESGFLLRRARIETTFRFFQGRRPCSDFTSRSHQGHFIEIFKADPAAEIRNQRIHHFCLEVDDIDAMRDALIKHGVEVTPKKLGCDQTWQCWCKDPDGTDLEFQQYTAQSSQFIRKNCIVDW